MALQPIAQPVQVSLTAELAETANKIAKKQGWTLSQALLYLAERGDAAQKEANSRIADAFSQLQQASSDTPQYELASDALYHAIFG